jgi:hypothetical protein
MRKLFLLLIFGLLSGVAYCPANEKCLYITMHTPTNPYLKLFEAVCSVESGNNPKAYNAKECAIGICQIRAIRLQDYNNRTHQRYSLRQMYDPELSKQIFLYYSLKYNNNDIRAICRDWNGHGKGNKEYYNKVMRRLKSVLKT